MTLRDQLRVLGVPSRRIPLAIPYMFFSAATVDRNAAGVREIVRALQHRLRDLGFDVDLGGVIGVKTTRALDRLVPPAGSFVHRSFSELTSIVTTATRAHHTTLGGLSGWEYGRDRSNCVGLGATKGEFVRLQKSINRLSSKLKTPRVKTDGIIGKTTVSAARAIVFRIYDPPSEHWNHPTCETLANHAAKISTAFDLKADALGIPKKGKAPSRPGPRPEVGTLATAEIGTSPSATILKFAPYVLIAGGVAFLAVKMRGG